MSYESRLIKAEALAKDVAVGAGVTGQHYGRTWPLEGWLKASRQIRIDGCPVRILSNAFNERFPDSEYTTEEACSILATINPEGLREKEDSANFIEAVEACR